MRAVVYSGAGGPEVAALEERREPEPGPEEVLVAVRAAGLNRADVLQRRGFYPAPPGAPANIPGLEFVGVVERCGARAGRWLPGDRVMAIVAGGAHAERIAVHERALVRVPRTMSDVEAAAIPEVFFTAWDALVLQGDLGRGQRVLIHAIGSGVGTAGLQIARLVGARVAGTARSPEKVARAEAEGLDLGILTADGFTAAALEDTFPGGVDVVLDLVGGAYLEENVRALRRGGRIVTIGLLGGLRGTLDLAALLTRRLTLCGSTLRSRPLEEKIVLARRFERELVPAFESGNLTAVVDRALPFEAFAEAHAAMEANATYGKIVLTW